MSHRDALHDLTRALAARQDVLLQQTEADEAIRRRIAEHAAMPRGVPRRNARIARSWIWAAAAMALVTVAALLVFRLRDDRRRLSFTVGDPPRQGAIGELASAPSHTPLLLRFSEGTTVLLQPAARGRVVRLTPNGAELILESGRAELEITPRPGGDWSVRTGPFGIRVKGTKFGTEYRSDTDEFSLNVSEGRVLVTGCDLGDGREVAAGEHLSAFCTARPADTRPSDRGASPSEPSEVGAIGGLGDGAANPSPVHSPPAQHEQRGRSAGEPRGRDDTTAFPGAAQSRSWAELGREGRYDEAFELVRERFSEECRRGDRADVWLLGNVARLSGHAREARWAYIAERDRFPGTMESTNAAFALGRLALEADKDRAAGQRWFETYLREGPGGALAPAALGRLMELHMEQGNHQRALAIADEYLRRYPDGPHAVEARRLRALPGESGN